LKISIIVPALNEAQGIAAALAALASLRNRGHEVIVVDGRSSDKTAALSRGAADRVVAAARGRASQMNAGAALAQDEVLLFLHADTRLPENADARILQGLAATGRAWGRFDVRIEGKSRLLPVIAFFMNLRSRATGIATGDQAIFVRRDAFWRIGGYPPLDKAVTSGRRWERHGVLRTVLLMWWLRLAFFFGATPASLARLYDGERS